ncbi:xanthine dehydrogenase family protein molybdopterin-binding subunit [Hespellia stercorisuis]|uniref:Molybdopterin-binding domain of aldehyde dehydrogenase n=1 Tax=Hespellia stercorisuis DSM 15480 TaxID=1121950 RepID=A0A1M6VEB6_9FIRM|nr:molybdopterin cofactor-binding domain-containing protein [Hespellia stercorisuis]SHK79626.1 Molybdopterin-binding domain of aldehyde dehydrogenase [Hespellia stercorisuis DSM 15480]
MIRQGKGIACMWYGVGNTGLPNPAGAFVEVLSDASVNLMVGCADIGQGSTTVMAQIAAEELGVRYEDVNVTSADSAVTPEGGATSASRQTFISGNATKKACQMAKQTLAEVAAEVLQVSRERLKFENRQIYDMDNLECKLSYRELMGEMAKRGRLALGQGYYNPNTTMLDPDTMQGSPFEIYSYAATMVTVEVNTDTGRIELKEVISAHDVGRAINKRMVEAQIEGGCAMGQGFAILEKVIVENGKILNPQFSKYLIPTALDMPDIYPIVVESNAQAGPFGAKGVGEPALIPIIPAIVNAVEDAIGVHFYELPITPTDVIRELYHQQKLYEGIE